MKITAERQAAAEALARHPLSPDGSRGMHPRATAAYYAAVKGIEADQNRVGVHAFPGLRFEDASGDGGLAFVHPLALDRGIVVSLAGATGNGEPDIEVTHFYSPGQARALAWALLVLADEAEADSAEVIS